MWPLSFPIISRMDRRERVTTVASSSYSRLNWSLPILPWPPSPKHLRKTNRWPLNCFLSRRSSFMSFLLPTNVRIGTSPFTPVVYASSSASTVCRRLGSFCLATLGVAFVAEVAVDPGAVGEREAGGEVGLVAGRGRRSRDGPASVLRVSVEERCARCDG